MSAERNPSGAFTVLLSLDFKFVNSFKETLTRSSIISVFCTSYTVHTSRFQRTLETYNRLESISLNVDIA